MNFDRMHHDEFVGSRGMYSFLCITVEEQDFPKSKHNLHKKLCSVTGPTKQWFIPLFPLRLGKKLNQGFIPL